MEIGAVIDWTHYFHHTIVGDESVIQKAEGKTNTYLNCILTLIQQQNDPNATQPSPKTKESQDDSVIQTLGITIAVVNTTKELVPISLVKGILGTIGNILNIVQVNLA
jgi:hypothetical protein